MSHFALFTKEKTELPQRAQYSSKRLPKTPHCTFYSKDCDRPHSSPQRVDKPTWVRIHFPCIESKPHLHWNYLVWGHNTRHIGDISKYHSSSRAASLAFDNLADSVGTHAKHSQTLRREARFSCRGSTGLRLAERSSRRCARHCVVDLD
jgi:hypothetical protein